MNIHLRIHQEFMKLGRTVSAFSSTYGANLSTAESHLLGEVTTGRASTAKELAYYLNLPKGTISRLVSGLIERKLLREKVDANDRRSKKLEGTKAGEKLGQTVGNRGNQIVPLLASRLSKEEAEELNSYFHEFSNLAGAPPAHVRKGEFFLRAELRRFIRVMGFMNPRFKSSKLNLGQKEILSAIRDLDKLGKSNASEIAKMVRIEPSNLSSMLSKFEKLGLIKREKSKDDTRKLIISLSKTGVKELETIEAELAQYFAKLFNGATQKQIERFANLLSRFGDPEGTLGLTRVLQRRLEVKEIVSDIERQRARAYYVEELVKAQEHLTLPERIVSENAINFALLEDSVLNGICSIDSTKASLEIFWTEKELQDSGADLDLLRTSVDHACAKLGCTRVIVNANTAKGPAKKLNARTEKGDLVLYGEIAPHPR